LSTSAEAGLPFTVMETLAICTSPSFLVTPRRRMLDQVSRRVAALVKSTLAVTTL
jgi:hypothetical protein